MMDRVVLHYGVHYWAVPFEVKGVAVQGLAQVGKFHALNVGEETRLLRPTEYDVAS